MARRRGRRGGGRGPACGAGPLWPPRQACLRQRPRRRAPRARGGARARRRRLDRARQRRLPPPGPRRRHDRRRQGGAPVLRGAGHRRGVDGRRADRRRPRGERHRPADDVDAVIAAAGDRRLVLVGVHVPRRWQDGNNDVLRAAAAAHPTVEFVDWDALVDAHPGVLGPDGVHPGVAGRTLLADRRRRRRPPPLDAVITGSAARTSGHLPSRFPHPTGDHQAVSRARTGGGCG